LKASLVARKAATCFAYIEAKHFAVDLANQLACMSASQLASNASGC
jgi:hypothetical protein